MPKGKSSKSTHQRYLYFQKTLHKKQQTLSLQKQPSRSPLQAFSSNTLSSDTFSSNDDISLLYEENEKLQNEVRFHQQQQLILQKQLMQQEDLKQQLKEFATSLTWEQKMRNRDREVYEEKMRRLREAHYNNTQQWRELIAQKDKKIMELEGHMQRIEEENIYKILF